ncbi:alpha/beta fold hydrolase [Nocardia sp. NPDC059691]|uniref:alpha/beta fold hydrolase n=1 Tax=Nocardia sp. NPDC059691 TaxID=3346908 RepID=UPI0036A1DECC
MRDFMRGETLRPEDWSGIPTLVTAGGKSDALLRKGARAIAAVLPDAVFREILRLGHHPNIGLLAPVAGSFRTGADQPAGYYARLSARDARGRIRTRPR